MTRFICSIACVISLLSSAPALTQAQTKNVDALQKANQGTIGLVSGPFGSTALNFASDMAEVLDDFDTFETRLVVKLGKGTGQNIADLLYLKGTDIAIVQTDVLDHIRRNKIYRNIDGLLRYVTKLHDKEIHLLASKNISNISDLNGMVVNLGPQQSGSFITGSLLLGLSGIESDIRLDTNAVAVRKLLAGEIDAAVIVDGKPSALLTNLPSDHSLHLLPIENEFMAEKYNAASFEVSDYPNLVPEAGSVPTLAVETVLAIYNWRPDNKRFPQAMKFINRFFNKFAELQSGNYHPKWQSVDIRAEVDGWERFSAATTWLEKNPIKVAEPEADPLRLQFEAFLQSTQPNTEWTPEQKDLLFQQFRAWQKQNN
jgi:uncharacterized protein